MSITQKPQDHVGVMIKLLMTLLRIRLDFGRYSGLRLMGGIVDVILFSFCEMVITRGRFFVFGGSVPI